MNRPPPPIAGYFVCILLGLGVCPAHAAPGVAGGPAAALLEQSESAFEKARSLLGTDPAAADAALDESIAASRALLGLGIDNASIHRNIGTAFMLRGDPGRAIVEFRRAERIDPTDPRVRESLAAARALVRTEVDPGPRSRVEDAVLFWRGRVSRGAMLAVGLAGWALVWFGATARLFTRRGAGVAVAGAVVALLTLGSLAAEHTIETMNPGAVIVQDGVVGYRGPSESVYTPTFEQPIRAGVEAAVLEQRDGWTRLRLRSGAETWVPTDSIERI